MPGRNPPGQSDKRQKQNHGIAHRVFVHRPSKRGASVRWRGCAGLANFHVNDVAPVGFGLTRGFHDIHHDKGINPGSA